MVEKNKYLSFAIGAAMSVTLAAAPSFAANSNVFEVKPLQNGYLVAQADTKSDDAKTDKEAKCSKKKMKDGKCAKDKDAKCGKDKDGHCSKKEMKDGKCGKNKDGHCGHDKKEEVKSEGKGGEAKCGKGGCGSTTSGGKEKKKEKKQEE